MTASYFMMIMNTGYLLPVGVHQMIMSSGQPLCSFQCMVTQKIFLHKKKKKIQATLEVKILKKTKQTLLNQFLHHSFCCIFA